MDLFLESLYEDKTVAADNVCLYLAKSNLHNASFCRAIEVAQDVQKRPKPKKKEPKEPFVRPADLIMYDGADPSDEFAVK